jgi:type II secretory pathway predicted ATPase ExeA
MVLATRRAFDLVTNEREKTPVVIVNEAHPLGHRMLEKPRLGLNVRMDARAGAALVLVDHRELRRSLRLSIHEALWQRTVVRSHLKLPA